MTIKTHKRLMTIGVFALVLMVPTIMKLEEIRLAGLYPTPFSKFLYTTFAIELLVAFFGLGVCGIFARWVTFLSKHPIHNAKGYDKDFSPDFGREEGFLFSQGYNRRWERRVFKIYKTVGLIIQDEGVK